MALQSMHRILKSFSDIKKFGTKVCRVHFFVYLFLYLCNYFLVRRLYNPTYFYWSPPLIALRSEEEAIYMLGYTGEEPKNNYINKETNKQRNELYKPSFQTF